jgi:hypothetical protein
VSSLERWWVFRLDRVAAALRHVSAEAVEAHELEVLGRALRCLEPPGYAVGDVHWLTRRERRDGG